ncbi:LytR C-terminal domain-containing protein [Conexibacter woesei]|uniref:LytR C-terminal domain-containing protein n=1 Tax=Conexibacter woesei TaxID=191495 RepID=UPI000416DBCA|nr:LytR C-terminal domain-containing protein [Conexibacter woesei]
MTQSDPTNFFDDLEHQLVAATTDRPRRLRRARTRRLATLCTVLVALLAVGGGLAAALSNNSTNNDPGAPAARQQHTPATAPARTTPATGGRVCGRNVNSVNGVRTVDPSTIEIAVLNGTTVPGLARGVANRLQNSRWKIGTVTNAGSQDHSETLVYYSRAACRTAAILVAQAIDLQSITRGTKPMHARVAVIAGPSADVVVVVGSDQNQRP